MLAFVCHSANKGVSLAEPPTLNQRDDRHVAEEPDTPRLRLLASLHAAAASLCAIWQLYRLRIRRWRRPAVHASVPLPRVQRIGDRGWVLAGVGTRNLRWCEETFRRMFPDNVCGPECG
jgi:hypothetical protein